MEDIRTQPRCDKATISEAYRLSKKFKDPTFLQLLEFFPVLVPEMDVLYNILQKWTIDATGVSGALLQFKEFVKSFPTPERDCAVKHWPLGSKEKSKTELTTLYHYSMGRQPCLCNHPSTKKTWTRLLLRLSGC